MNPSERARRHRETSGGRVGRRRRPILAVLALLVSLLACYAAVDIFWPLHRDLTQFDPVAVGTLETKMWRSYYDRRPVMMFLQLAETLRTQYRQPLLRSYVGAYYGASAAFTFKDGKERRDYEKALPALQTYFSIIHNTGNIDFNVRRTTVLELEWWIVHRERDRYPPGALGQACAKAAASLYGVPADSVLAHGQLRAEAMLMRDARDETGGVTESDWMNIELLLHQSYRALRDAVSSANAIAGEK